MNFNGYTGKLKKFFSSSNVLVIILIGLLIGNYFYTFGGFVAYTETERRGCDLLSHVYTLKTKEDRVDFIKKLLRENQEVVLKYLNQFVAKDKRCKTIERFYFEEGILILATVVLVFRRKIINK